MNISPYIGITDFTRYAQVEYMANVFRDLRTQASQRVLHVGVMMSYKTLNGIETKYSKAFPPKEAIASIFASDDHDIYNCLHYADYEGQTTFLDLERAITLAGPRVNALQLDMPWPRASMIAQSVNLSRKKIEVILQIGAKALEEADNDPDIVVRRLEEYAGVVHRVLLDKSMGRGLGMDAVGLLPFARAIQARFPDTGLVVAGGLGPQTLHLVEPLIKEFPDLSIDAQGKLRPSGSNLDPIDWDMAAAYLVKALELLP